MFGDEWMDGWMDEMGGMDGHLLCHVALLIHHVDIETRGAGHLF